MTPLSETFYALADAIRAERLSRAELRMLACLAHQRADGRAAPAAA